MLPGLVFHLWALEILSSLAANATSKPSVITLPLPFSFLPTQLAAPIPSSVSPGSNLLLRDMHETATESAGKAEAGQVLFGGAVNKPLLNAAHGISNRTGPGPESWILYLTKSHLIFFPP